METQDFGDTLRPAADFAGMLGYYLNLALYHEPIANSDDTYNIAMRAYTPVAEYVGRSMNHQRMFELSFTDGLSDTLVSYMNSTFNQYFTEGNKQWNVNQVIEVALLLLSDPHGYRTDYIEHDDIAGSALIIILWLFQANRGIDVLSNAYTTVSAAFPNLLNAVSADDEERFVYHVAWVIMLLQSTLNATHAVNYDTPWAWREPLIIDDLIDRVQDIPAFLQIVNSVQAFVAMNPGVS